MTNNNRYNPTQIANQWLALFTLGFFLFIASIAFTNIRYDYNLLIGSPWSYTHQRIDQVVKKLLNDEEPIMHKYNRNQGVLLKKKLMLEQDFNTLLLGRSRTMLISPNHLHNSNSRFFNASVDGGGDPAIIGLWQSYKENRLQLTDTIFLEVYFDMILTPSFLAVKSPPLYPELRRFRQNNPQVLTSPADAQELSAADYILSLDYLYKNLTYNHDEMFFTQSTNELTGHYLFSAGHQRYSRPRASEDQVQKLAISEGEGFQRRGMKNLADLPDHSTFTALVADIIQSGLSPILVLPPFNPTTYDLSLEASNILPFIEAWVINFAQKHQLQIVGSFNPHHYNLDSSYFRDGNHLELAAWDIIFDNFKIGEIDAL